MGEVQGILNDEAIKREITQGKLVFNGSVSAVNSCSYDMTVGTIFRSGTRVKSDDPSHPTQVIIQPGEIISLFTKEELHLPDDIMATAFAMNAMSSQGILVLNPGHVDPGYKGPLTVRAINVRQTPKAITIGTEIFTVIFERLPARSKQPFTRNVSREKSEIKYNEMDLEQNPGSLADLVFKHGKPAHIVDEAKVTKMIRDDALVRFNNILSGIAAFAGIAALVFTIFPIKSTPVNNTQSQIDASPSPSKTVEAISGNTPFPNNNQSQRSNYNNNQNK